HNWVINAVTDLIFNRLEQKSETNHYRWDSMLGGGSQSKETVSTNGASESAIAEPEKVAAKAKPKATKTATTPKPKATRAKKVETAPKAVTTPKRPRAKKIAE
ncbi:MAG: hypothetical protein H7Z37_16490, partial [Pyrinomonadaceae bacterium]|nr:hypothetical protein [Pyrinomonadaceae bacterium]